MALRSGGGGRNLFSRAVALLARREHSRAELAAKLRRGLAADDDPGEIDRVLDALEKDNLLSDERFAAVLTRARSARFGDARLRFDLRSSGVKPESAERAVTALKGTELDRARAVWARRFPAPPATPQERARQARFLQARGFSSATIRALLRGLPAED